MKKLFIVSSLGLSTLYFTNNIDNLNALHRGNRVFLSGLKISYNYYKNGINDQTHDVCAGILYKTLLQNGGAYVKLGQVIAQLDHILPEIFCNKMKPLCQNCDKIPFSTVEKLLNEHFNGDYKSQLASLEKEPIGVASLAQVHKATLKSGEVVAIKIQHPRLKKEVSGDIRLIKLATKIASKLFKEFKYEWLGDQFERNLPTELNFLNEGENCIKFNEIFKGNNYITAPSIFKDLSSQTILVMSFEEGGSIEDPIYLKENKISVDEISNILSVSFAEQIFKYGFVHADPHSGNILVRKRENKIQVVMLDHGLYRVLDDDFRYHYSNFWRGVLRQDKVLIRDSCKGLNISLYELFTSIILSKRYEHIMDKNAYSEERFSMKLSQDAKLILKQDVQEYHKEITQVLNDVRQEMLLLLKINEYLRAIDRQLGHPYNNFKTIMRIIYRELPSNPVFIKNKDSLLRLNFEKVYYYTLFRLNELWNSIYNIISFQWIKSKDTDLRYRVFADTNNLI